MENFKQRITTRMLRWAFPEAIKGVSYEVTFILSEKTVENQMYFKPLL